MSRNTNTLPTLPVARITRIAWPTFSLTLEDRKNIAIGKLPQVKLGATNVFFPTSVAKTTPTPEVKPKPIAHKEVTRPAKRIYPAISTGKETSLPFPTSDSVKERTSHTPEMSPDKEGTPHKLRVYPPPEPVDSTKKANSLVTATVRASLAPAVPYTPPSMVILESCITDTDHDPLNRIMLAKASKLPALAPILPTATVPLGMASLSSILLISFWLVLHTAKFSLIDLIQFVVVLAVALIALISCLLQIQHLSLPPKTRVKVVIGLALALLVITLEIIRFVLHL